MNAARIFRGAVSRHVAPANKRIGAVRNLNLHEYQSKILMDTYNVNTQNGKEANTADEAAAIAQSILDQNPKAELIVKAQIHAGGRGKGVFKSGFKGGVQICTTPEQVRENTEAMLGQVLVTKQTGDAGQECNTVLINEGLDIQSEKYFAILMDRAFNGPVLVASAEGGMDIEEVAESNPDAIHSVGIDVMTGPTDEQVEGLAAKIGFEGEHVKAAGAQMKNMYEMMMGTDGTQVEINPFVVGSYSGRDEAGDVFCVDAKLNFDDNAEFRHKELFAQRDTKMEDPRDVQAEEIGVTYIGLDGNIACLVNGAGLAMATMDIIKMYGAEPANFCDLGGGVTAEQVEQAFKLVLEDDRVEGILVNIFGGIARCDTIANGIVEAAEKLDFDKYGVPLVVRLEGTNVELGKEILANSTVKIVTANDLDDAAQKCTAAIA
jgi:succinyl-CoA synthetase beta subunit